MSISPQGIVETHALLEDFLLLNQLPGATFLHSTYSFMVVKKNTNRTSIIVTVNTRISWAETMQMLDGADHQEAWRSSSSPPIERAELEHGREGLQGLQGWALRGRCRCKVKDWWLGSIPTWIGDARVTNMCILFHLVTAGNPVRKEAREGEHTFCFYLFFIGCKKSNSNTNWWRCVERRKSERRCEQRIYVGSPELKIFESHGRWMGNVASPDLKVGLSWYMD